MTTPIPIYLVGPENWEASHVFNSNNPKGRVPLAKPVGE